MATIEKYLPGTTVTLLSTELNSLATSSGLTAGAISSVGGTSGLFNNTPGGGGFDGYTFANFELKLAAPAGTLTANTGANIWFLSTVDGGSTYEDGSASVIPARPADLVLGVRAVNTAQVIHRRWRLEPGNWFVLLAHNTGQTWASSGNTLKVYPLTRQGV
jgi:hypothetical protein